MKRVLIVCECSGVVRDAFLALGHDAWSCDLKADERGSTRHLKIDALVAIRRFCIHGYSTTPTTNNWDIIIAHPPCTFLNSAGLHWNNRGRGHQKTDDALRFVSELMGAMDCHARIGWALENPAGKIGTSIRKWNQSVQPYEFGDDASKTTGLWLHNLPNLVRDPSKYIAPRWVCVDCGHVSTDEDSAAWIDPKGQRRCHRHRDSLPKLMPRWANQTDSGRNKLAPGPTRAADRARTYQGIAKAMAEQWGSLNPANRALA